MSEPRDTTPPKAPKRNGGGLSDRAAAIIIGLVTAIWAVNILAGMFQVNGYRPAESVNGIFMAIVGGAFIARARGSGGE